MTGRLGTVVAGVYRIVRPIGSGGSSHVFEAEHVRLGKAFALKLLRPELDPTLRTAQRFRREARAIARLSSEYIVSVVDCGELDDGTPYLVMELLRGEDLRSLLKREKSLPARRAVHIALDVCRALAEAHAAGLVHRDLKPENLFIARRATGEDWCKVLDFGVAKMDASLSTTEGAIVGTVRYMAPEQLADGAKVGPATDIYALGAILHECLTGRSAHAGETIQETMFSVLNTELQPLGDVSASLSSLVLSCLRKDPARRPASAQQLESMLCSAFGLREGAAAERTISEDVAEQASPRASARSRRTPRFLISTALGAVLSLGALAWSWSRRSPERVTTAQPQALSEAVPLERPQPRLVPAAQERPAIAIPVSPASAAVSTPKPREKSPHANPSPGKVSDVAPSPPPHPTARAAAVGNLDPANPYAE